MNQGAARDAAAALRHFTKSGIASRLGITEAQATPLIRWLLARGIIVALGHVHLGGRGRPPALYAYIDPRTIAGPKKRPTTPDLMVKVGRASSSAGSGRRTTSGVKEVDELVRAVERSGGRVDRAGGHLKAYPPDGGRPVSLPSSKANRGHLNGVKRTLRNRGVSI